MKKACLLLVIFLFLLAACGDSDADVTETAESVPTNVALAEPTVEPTAVPTNTAVPEPTATPEPTDTPAPALITSADEIVGIWLGALAGETGYVMYTADGRFYVALTEENLVSAPRVTGEYWFEDGQIHLRDLANAGHWTECSAEVVGIYDVLDLGEKTVQFQTVDDACNEGGFTRNYLFANLKQEWQSEPVAIAGETMPELATALQAIADTWVNENGVPSVIFMVDMPNTNFTCSLDIPNCNFSMPLLSKKLPCGISIRYTQLEQPDNDISANNKAVKINLLTMKIKYLFNEAGIIAEHGVLFKINYEFC